MKTKALCVAVLLSAAACGGDASGTLNVTIYGEEFIEEGIPADVFSDGWSATYQKFQVNLGEVTAAIGEGAPAISSAAYKVYDLVTASNGEGQPVASATVPGGKYDHVGYRIAPSGTTPAIYIEATFTKAAVTKKVKWTFNTKTKYGHCESVAHVNGAAAKSQITIHADHFLYDDLFSAEPNVSFDLAASADTNNDGEVTEAELRLVDLTNEARYQVGSTGIKNLWDFIAYQSGTVGHIDGEGHCADSIRE